MSTIEELQKTWESLAKEDPLWAICTAPDKRGGKWDRTDFFASGRNEIEIVLTHLRSRNIPVNGAGRVLDFGCGVGRLTQALCEHFAACAGVDISARMVQLAREFNAHGKRCEYFQNPLPHLAIFRDNSFDFIYSSIVLQHIDPQLTRQYLKEFVRVLRPSGVLVFQVPDYARSLRERLALRSRLKRIVGMRATHPHVYNGMEMNWIAEGEVRSILRRAGCSIIDTQITNSCEPEFFGHLRYLSEPSERGFISKQYCALKLH